MESNGQSENVSFCLVFRAFWQINSTASWPTVPPPPHMPPSLAPWNSWCVTGSTISHFFPKALQLLLLNPSFLIPCWSKLHLNIRIGNLASVHLSPLNILLISEREKGGWRFSFLCGRNNNLVLVYSPPEATYRAGTTLATHPLSQLLPLEREAFVIINLLPNNVKAKQTERLSH